MRYDLTFISAQDLYHHVRETIEKYRFVMCLDSFIKILWQYLGYNQSRLHCN